jgi:cytochrome c-type biogenesis protein
MFAQNLSFFIAFAAGLLSFLSPCILPIIPSFLSFLGGVSHGDLIGQRASRKAVFFQTLFFVAGFSTVFVALGAVFSSAGLMLAGAQTLVYRVAGIVVVIFGLNIVFDFWKALNIERRFHLNKRPRGLLGSALIGLAFGAGWTPCVGPILASILFLAGTSGTMTRGIALLAIYSMGLGAPFLLAGLFFSSFTRYAERLRARMHGIKVASGIFLIFLGVLIFIGSLARLNTAFFGLAAALGRWGQRSPAGPRLIFGLFFMTLSCLVAALYARRIGNVLRTTDTSVRAFIFPVPLALLFVFLFFSILTFAGVLDFPSLISFWLRFQGI